MAFKKTLVAITLLCNFYSPVLAQDKPAEKAEIAKPEITKSEITKSEITKSERPYTVNLPSGWDVNELKAPKQDSGKEMAGGRIRALKKDGAGLAVIELTYMPRTDAGQANLDAEFAAFIDTLKSEYENKGLKATTTVPKAISLGSLPSSEVEITVVGQNKELRQWFAMAMGQKYVYALSYTGEKEFYDKFQSDFAKCRESLVVQ